MPLTSLTFLPLLNCEVLAHEEQRRQRMNLRLQSGGTNKKSNNENQKINSSTNSNMTSGNYQHNIVLSQPWLPFLQRYSFGTDISQGPDLSPEEREELFPNDDAENQNSGSLKGLERLRTRSNRLCQIPIYRHPNLEYVAQVLHALSACGFNERQAAQIVDLNSDNYNTSSTVVSNSNPDGTQQGTTSLKLSVNNIGENHVCNIKSITQMLYYDSFPGVPDSFWDQVPRCFTEPQTVIDEIEQREQEEREERRQLRLQEQLQKGATMSSYSTTSLNQNHHLNSTMSRAMTNNSSISNNKLNPTSSIGALSSFSSLSLKSPRILQRGTSKSRDSSKPRSVKNDNQPVTTVTDIKQNNKILDSIKQKNNLKDNHDVDSSDHQIETDLSPSLLKPPTGRLIKSNAERIREAQKRMKGESESSSKSSQSRSPGPGPNEIEIDKTNSVTSTGSGAAKTPGATAKSKAKAKAKPTATTAKRRKKE